MDVVRHGSAADFLSATAGLRAAEPVLTNVISGVAGAVAAGQQSYDRELWLSVIDRGISGAGGVAGRVVGIAMRTSPYNLVVSPMPAASAQALGAALVDLDPEIPGIVGPQEVADEVASAFGAGERARVRMRETVQVLGALAPLVHPVAGRARPLGTEDLELAARWLVAFSVEADLTVRPTLARARDQLERTAERTWVWESGGAAVAMAGHAPLVEGPSGLVARIGPVYTPPEHRGSGYGSAVTRALAADLAAKCAVVMLFTDADYPTSNRIYRALGFEQVAEMVELELRDA